MTRVYWVFGLVGYGVIRLQTFGRMIHDGSTKCKCNHIFLHAIYHMIPIKYTVNHPNDTRTPGFSPQSTGLAGSCAERSHAMRPGDDGFGGATGGVTCVGLVSSLGVCHSFQVFLVVLVLFLGLEAIAVC